jgi:hypothetical protein
MGIIQGFNPAPGIRLMYEHLLVQLGNIRLLHWVSLSARLGVTIAPGMDGRVTEKDGRFRIAEETDIVLRFFQDLLGVHLILEHRSLEIL